MIDKQKEFRIGLILNYVATAIGLISSLAFNPIIIRALGKSEYGLYETIGSFVNYLAVLDLGFGAVVIRYTAKYEAEGQPHQRDEFLYRARRIYQYLVAAVLLCGAVLYCVLDPVFGNTFTAEEMRKARIMFLFVLGTTALSIYGQVFSGALTGMEKFILPRVIRVLKIILGKIVSILVILGGADSIGYTIVLFGFEAIAVLVNRVAAARYVTFAKCRVRFADVKELLVFTGFIFLQAIAAQLYWQIDKLVLGAMIGPAIVAVYSVSLNLHNIVQNISSSVKDVLLPKATKIAVGHQTADQTQQFVVRAGRLVAMVYGLALAGIAVLGREFLFLWLGAEYMDAYVLYLIIGFASFIPCILTIGETVCRAYNKHQFLSYVSVAAAFINVVLTIVFVKIWGVIGAAAATSMGLLFANTLIPLVYYKKVFHWNILRLFTGILKGSFPALLFAVASGVAVNLLLTEYSWLALIVKAIVMCAVFAGSMLLFGFNAQEKITVMRMATSLILRKPK